MCVMRTKQYNLRRRIVGSSDGIDLGIEVCCGAKAGFTKIAMSVQIIL
jgi:hypothetical protein